MKKVDYTWGGITGAFIGENLLLTNLFTGKYFLEKKIVVAKYIVTKLFINNNLELENSLDRYVFKVYNYLNKKVKSIPDDYVLYFELTNKCNLRCKHCYNDSNSLLGYTNREMSIETMRKVVDSNINKIRFRIILSGGEPTLHSEFSSILTMLDKYNVPTTIYTNGINVCDYGNEFFKYRNNVVISLDGVSSRQHDFIRGKGNFKKVSTNIALLRTMLEPEQILFAYTINRYNLSELRGMFLMAEQNNVKRIFINPVAYLGRNKEAELGLNEKQLTDMWCKLIELQNEFSHIDVICDTFWKISKIYNNEIIPYDCSICRKLRISVDGNVFPCTFFDDKEILQQNICKTNELIFGGNKYTNVVNKAKKRTLEFCKDCIFSVLCNGGCPANGYVGGIWGVSPIECKAKQDFYEKMIGEIAD